MSEKESRKINPIDELHYDNLIKNENNLKKSGRILRKQNRMAPFPSQQEFKIKLTSMLTQYREILQPTIENCTRDTTKAEISERSYLKLSTPIAEFNKCMKSSLDYADIFDCQNNLLNFIENDGLEFARELAREY